MHISLSHGFRQYECAKYYCQVAAYKDVVESRAGETIIRKTHQLITTSSASS